MAMVFLCVFNLPLTKVVKSRYILYNLIVNIYYLIVRIVKNFSLKNCIRILIVSKVYLERGKLNRIQIFMNCIFIFLLLYQILL